MLLLGSRSTIARAALCCLAFACARPSSPPGDTSAARGAIDISVAPAASASSSTKNDAVPAAAPGASRSREPATEGVCTTPCRGKPTAALVDALSHRAKQAHRCYDLALATDPTVRGRVMQHIVVGSDGRSCSARAEAEGPMAGVARCVEGYFKPVAGDPVFPPPEGGCAELTLPINFVPRSDGGAP